VSKNKGVINVEKNNIYLSLKLDKSSVSKRWGRALNSVEFVKALRAGTGTDHSSIKDGRALIGENIGSVGKDGEGIKEDVALFLSEVSKGKIKSEEDIKSFLDSLGENSDKTLDSIKELVYKYKEKLEEVLPMVKWDDILSFVRKSKKVEEPSKTEDEVLDDDVKDDDGDDDEKEKDKNIEDATSVLKSLTSSIVSLAERLDRIEKTQEARDAELSKAIGSVTAEIEKIGETPESRASMVNSNELLRGGGGQNMSYMHKAFTREALSEISEILYKKVEKGELSLLESGKIEGQINKSIAFPTYQLDQKYIRYIEQILRESERIQ